jgi:signal transduction histidine kinase
MSRTWSIRSHLLALVVLTFLPLLVLLLQAVYVDLQESVEVAERNSLALAETTAASVAQLVDDAELVLEGIANREELTALDEPACSRYLADVQDLLPRFANVFAADTDSRVVCSALPAPAGGFEDVRDRAWFAETLAAGQLTIGAPQVGRISGRWVSVIALPIRGVEGEVVGVLGAALDLYRFQEFLATSGASGGTVLTIDDPDGVVVARSADPESWVGRPLPPSGLDRDLLSQPRGGTFTAGAEGVERVWGFAQIAGTRWRAWAGIPASEVYAPARAAALRKVLLVLLALFSVGGVSLILHRRVRASLDGLSAASSRVGAGSHEPLPETGPMELRRVAHAFNGTLEALREAESRRLRTLERYRAILEQAVFGIVVTDAENLILEANPALAAILGVPDPQSLRGRLLPDLFEDHLGAPALLEAALASPRTVPGDAPRSAGTPRGIQATWRGPDELPISVRLVGTRNHDAEGNEVREWMVEDVTEQLRLETRLRQGQKLEAVGRLAGGVAHDFNNLLTVITTAADLLRQDHPDAPGVREAAGEILDASALGASLTRQLLTFSRRQVVQPRRLDLNEVVSRTTAFLARLAGPDTPLSTRLDDAPAPIEADPGQVEQVLLNLVVNARDASPKGAVVEVRVRSLHMADPTPVASGMLPPGAWVLLEVEDRGSGIPLDLRDRIFEPFFSTKDEGRGTGLGLATVYGIAVQAGGGVGVESREGEGSLFRVYFPHAGDG